MASTTTQLVKEVKAKGTKAQDAASRRLALLCIGEIGRRADLSGVAQVGAWAWVRVRVRVRVGANATAEVIRCS